MKDVIHESPDEERDLRSNGQLQKQNAPEIKKARQNFEKIYSQQGESF